MGKQERWTHNGIVEDRTPPLTMAYMIKVWYDPDFNVWFGEHDTMFNGIDGESCKPDEPFIPVFLVQSSITPIRKPRSR